MSRRKGRPSTDPADAVRFMVTRAGYVRRVLRSAGMPESEIDDGLQDVLVRAWNAVRAGRLHHEHPHAVRAWLRVVAVRVAIAHIARRARVVFIVDEDDAGASTWTHEGPNVAHDLVAVFRASTSPDNWRAWLMWAEGWTIHEIAKATGDPVGTVASRIRRARRDFSVRIRRMRARERRGQR